MKETEKLNKRIRKGDKVVAIAGNYKGQVGEVLSRSHDRAIVQGLNVRKKHVKPSQANPKGGVIEMERPIHLSNLRACTEEGKPVKLRVRQDEEGNRQLYYKDGDQEASYRSIKKT